MVSFTLADYSISTPGTGTVWRKGQTVEVKWTVTSQTDKTVTVKLLRGLASNLQLVQTICSGVDPNVGRCSFVVPGNLVSDRDYACTVGNDVNHLGYSSFFSIESKGNLPAQKGCPNFGGQNCPSTLPCCSSAGYCGDTDAHCGQGCMPQFCFNGVCMKSGGSPTIQTNKISTKKVKKVKKPKKPKH